MNELALRNDESELSTQRGGATIEMVSSRQSQEVQGAIVMAKNFPRDETQSLNRILQACKRKKLAEAAQYAYPRGGSLVTGPSIRLAECMAQAWGNLDFGIVELEQANGESHVMAYCWDLETNTRQTKVFTVKHERSTKSGNYALTDPRDIYEMVANNGARRLRACILGVIPGDIQEEAVDQCRKTLAGKNSEPLIDRVRKMVAAFGEQGVMQEHIEARLGHNLEATIETELVNLRAIYTSLKDGMSQREQWFDIASDPKPTKSRARTKPGAAAKSETEHDNGSSNDTQPGSLFDTSQDAAEM